MKSLLSFFSLVFVAALLGGCLASTTSSIGVACNPSTQSGPSWTWPLACQPGGGG